jgi:N-carbamoylputrescine amidase
MVIGIVQMAMGEDRDVNVSRGCEGVAEAVSAGANVICLPELFASRYFCQTEDRSVFPEAVSRDGSFAEEMARVAARHGVVLVVPYFERRAAGIYHNSAWVIDADGRVLGTYRKVHIPDDPSYYEKYYFTPGDLGFPVWETAFGTIGVLICWDQWFPEAARAMVLEGAEALIYPTAIGWHTSEDEGRREEQWRAWRTVQEGHAIANGVYVAAVNRTGFEPAPGVQSGSEGIRFWGRSFIVDPAGVGVGEARGEEECVISAVVDRGRLEQQRIEWPFLRDRRPGEYGGVLRQFKQ